MYLWFRLEEHKTLDVWYVAVLLINCGLKEWKSSKSRSLMRWETSEQDIGFGVSISKLITLDIGVPRNVEWLQNM